VPVRGGTSREIRTVWNVVSERWNINSDRKSQYDRVVSAVLCPWYPRDKHSRRHSEIYDVTVSCTFLDRNDDYYLLSLLIRLRFIASGSRTSRIYYIISRALSRAIYTLVHARARRVYIRYLIFIKSKCRAAPRHHLVDMLAPATPVSAINSQPRAFITRPGVVASARWK